MFGSKLLCILSVLVVCEFCGNDFKSLGRHIWRCKSRAENPTNQQNNEAPQAPPEVAADNVELPVEQPAAGPNTTDVHCTCGKKCRGIRGLRMHQRSCRVIKDLGLKLNEPTEPPEDVRVINDNNQVINDYIVTLPNIKVGVKLPRSDAQWGLADTFFRSCLPVSDVNNENVNECIELFNSTIYSYFRDTYGTVTQEVDSETIQEFNGLSKAQLKKRLKELKAANSDAAKIRYASKLLRSRVSVTSPDAQHVNSMASNDHDNLCNKNLWSYAKKFIEKPKSVLPTFDKSTCAEYFRRTLTTINPGKYFRIPSWIPQLSAPTVQFTDKPPTYAKVTRVIRKLKSSGSPCPLDQIPALCLKKCPYLRSYLTAVIESIWRTKTVPEAWKKAVTILIYKKGDTANPENFRPITLESIPLKVYTACVRDAIFEFAMSNKYIDCDLQKGFLPKVSGTYEHTTHMAHIINHSRLKQRQVVITLLDLKNAFGEVHHSLIDEVLKYHHVPQHMCEMIRSLYTNFRISICTEAFKTEFVTVGRGVLQGDCLSPLLFNMCFNTFLQYIKDEQFTRLGYRINSSISPRHWFQFADDASVVTSTEIENQILLSAFARWCSWAEMIIRVDKCHSFGMKKFISVSKQYKPKLYVGHEMIPPVEIGKSFTYLGRHFNYAMDDQTHKDEIIEKFADLMKAINELPLHPRNKIKLYMSYVLAKLSWHFTITDLSTTWMKENVDNVANDYFRRWLEMPISGTLDICMLSKKKFGIGLVEPSTKFLQCQSVIRSKLKASPNSDVRLIHERTKTGNKLVFDRFQSTRAVTKEIRTEKVNRVINLPSQGHIMKSIWTDTCERLCSVWPTVQSKMPKNIYNFSIRYLNNTLGTNSNLALWGAVESANCKRCNTKETLKHVVAGCPISTAERRFDWRHDSILKFIASNLSVAIGAKVYADIPGFTNPEEVVEFQRPDMIIDHITDNGTVRWIVELTAGYETNLQNNAKRKEDRYKDLMSGMRRTCEDARFVNLSVSCLGFFGTSCDTFNDMLCELGLDDTARKFVYKRIIEIAIRTTYYTFCCREREWTNPELLVV